MNDRFIGVGLTLAFLALISILAGVGYLGLADMRGLYEDTRSIGDHQWRDVQLAADALTYSNQNSRINMRLATLEDSPERRTLLAQRAENSARISDLLMQLQARVGSKREQEMLDAVVRERAAYLDACKRATEHPAPENPPSLGQGTMQAVLPLLLRYHKAWSDYVQFQTSEMNHQLEVSSDRYTRARTRTLYLLVFAVALALAIAGFVVSKLVGEILRRHTAEDNLTRLNEELELKVSQRTAALAASNQDLINEVDVRAEIEEKLRSKTAFLEAQANSTVDGILVVDSENHKIFQNRQFVELFQLPQAVIDNPDDRVALAHVTSQMSDPDGFLGKVRYLYEHKNEISRDEIELNCGMVLDRYSSPVIDNDGHYYGRIWVFRDITDRKRSEDVVRRLSMAVEQSPVSVVITDLHGDITYVNRTFMECTGYRSQELIGKNPRILKSGRTSKEVYRRLWSTITAGGEWRGELQNRKKNGELYWERAVIRPIQDERGNILHFLAIKEDITERRRMEAQLHQANKLEAIGQLAAGIAHEINTPMQFVGDNTRFLQQAWGTLNGMVSLIHPQCGATSEDPTALQRIAEELRAYDPADLTYLQAEVPKAIDQMLDGIARVSKIVQAMRTFSHPGSSERQLTDINKAIETTVTVARNEWKYVADLETILSEDVPPVPCYTGEFNQVILNLVVNSAHAIAQKLGKGPSEKGKITIRTRQEGNWVEISIQDTGCGIPPEAQPRVFDPFFTTKEVGKGTGQGLALAYAVVVNKHGGKIWFETEVGKGTTFFMRLPVQPESSEVRAEQPKAEPHLAEATESRPEVLGTRY